MSVVRAGVGRAIMYYVYVLQDKNGKIYKGFTNNLKRRLQEHKGGHTKTTRKMLDVKIVYTEEHTTIESARKREIYFKSAAGRRVIKNKNIAGIAQLVEQRFCKAKVVGSSPTSGSKDKPSL